MYVLINFSTCDNVLYPHQTIHLCEFSESLTTLQNKFNLEIENSQLDLSENEYDESDLTTHTIIITKLSNSSHIIFNPMTSHYVLSEPIIQQATYQSCDC